MIQQLLIVLIAGLIIYYPYLPEKVKNKLAVITNGTKLSRLSFITFIFFTLMYNIPLGAMLMILFFTIQTENKSIEKFINYY